MKKVIILLAGAFLVVAIIAGSYFWKQANDNHMLGMVGSTKVFSFVDSEAGVICWMTKGHLACIPLEKKEELTRGWLEERLIH